MDDQLSIPREVGVFCLAAASRQFLNPFSFVSSGCPEILHPSTGYKIEADLSPPSSTK